MVGGIAHRLKAALPRVPRPRLPFPLAPLRRHALPLAVVALLAAVNGLALFLAPANETRVSVAMPALGGRIAGDEPARRPGDDAAAVAVAPAPAPGPTPGATPAPTPEAFPLPAFEAPATPSLPERRQAPTLASLPQLNTSDSLPVAPEDGLVETTPQGKLPRLGGDGRAPWQAYARPVPEDAARQPRLAVVVAGLGLDSAVTEAVIAKLPADVTLAFSPYASNLQHWVHQARAAGHEVILELPMQSVAFPARDAGPLRLRPGEDHEVLIERLNGVLAKAVGYAGVLAPPDAALTAADAKLVLAALDRRGVMYVGGAPLSGSAAPPTAAVDLRLDDNPFREDLAARLGWLRQVAGERGHAVAVTEPLPAVLHHLVRWLPELDEAGVVLAPVSAIPMAGARS